MGSGNENWIVAEGYRETLIYSGDRLTIRPKPWYRTILHGGSKKRLNVIRVAQLGSVQLGDAPGWRAKFIRFDLKGESNRQQDLLLDLNAVVYSDRQHLQFQEISDRLNEILDARDRGSPGG